MRFPTGATWLRAASLVGMLATLCLACGAEGSDPVPKADPEPDFACGAEWEAFTDSIALREHEADPSSLPQRWNTLIAAMALQRTTPPADPCETLAEHRQTAADLEALQEQLRPFDITWRLIQIDREPITGPKRLAALEHLDAHAAECNADLKPGWEAAQVVTADDAKAVRALVKDLRFLANHGKAWPECDAALAVADGAIDGANQGANDGVTKDPSEEP